MKQFSFSAYKPLIALVGMMVCLAANAQPERLGSIYSLERSNGFKDIRLGAYTGEAKYKFDYMDGDSRLDADSCLKFDCNDSTLLKVADGLRLDMVGIRTYKGKIVNIYLFFKLSDGFKMLSHFLGAYGMFTSRRDGYSDVYYWDTGRVRLGLFYSVNTDLGVAVFTSKSLQDEIAARRTVLNKKDMVLLTSE